MEPEFIISVFSGIVPAMLLLFYIMEDFKGLFKDNKIFLSFVLGIIGGSIIFFLHRFFDYIFIKDIFLSIVGYVMGFSLIETLMKLIIVNWKKFLVKGEVVFYGCSVGLGVGSATIMAGVYYELHIVKNIVASGLITLIFVCMAYILVHGAIGIKIGSDLNRGKDRISTIVAAVGFQIPFMLVLLMFWWDVYRYFMVLLLIFYSGAIFIKFRNEIVGSFPRETRKKYRKIRRRFKR